MARSRSHAALKRGGWKPGKIHSRKGKGKGRWWYPHGKKKGRMWVSSRRR